MKKLIFSFSLIFSALSFAELYEDYEPSEQHTELTVISVQSNYLDDYLVNLKRTWIMRQEKLSKRYTTNWSELLEVK